MQRRTARIRRRSLQFTRRRYANHTPTAPCCMHKHYLAIARRHFCTTRAVNMHETRPLASGTKRFGLRHKKSRVAPPRSRWYGAVRSKIAVDLSQAQHITRSVRLIGCEVHSVAKLLLKPFRCRRRSLTALCGYRANTSYTGRRRAGEAGRRRREREKFCAPAWRSYLVITATHCATRRGFGRFLDCDTMCPASDIVSCTVTTDEWKLSLLKNYHKTQRRLLSGGSAYNTIQCIIKTFCAAVHRVRTKADSSVIH